MRAKTTKFKVSVLYASTLGVLLSLYVGFLFIIPLDLLQVNKLIFILAPIPLTLLFGYIIGQMIVGKILKPIKEITDTANNITTKI
jgi:uncharacterized protein YacL